MRFDTSSKVEQVLWNARRADLVRGYDRAILNRLYNGNPPYSESDAEENNIQVNRNDLSGVNLLSQARRQWNQAFLKPGNFFNVTLDSGPPHERVEWGHTITREINRRLKRNRGMLEQIRATGANVMLHGIGPVTWKDRQSPIPVPLPVSGLLISSETDIDFENLEWFAVFREWTPEQLYDLTHGKKVDPGWNMKLVNDRLKQTYDEYFKNVNSAAFHLMPERLEEAFKQDSGLFGTDAVSTVDVWDFYFRDMKQGNGWYRRVLLDWSLNGSEIKSVTRTTPKPESNNKDGDNDVFLYTSGERIYASDLSEILHCQFGDCSAVAPFKYHSVRSLGWMLWGVCDLNNRLYCKSMENAFEQLMWFFRTASDSDLRRLKKVNFTHMGVIPQGISFVPANERFKPDFQIVEGAFARNRALMMESASSYTQNADNTSGANQKTKTATQVMAEVNSVNALVSGMLSLAYTYEEYKYREIGRRYCIKDNKDKDVREFRKACLNAGVPAEMLDVERWDITAERTLGAGNKTLELSIVQGLQSIRGQLSPDGQRKVDHKYVEALTDDWALSEDLAPIEGEKKISISTHDAQLSSGRLLSGLPYTLPKGAIVEDFVIVWMNDLATVITTATKTGNVAEIEEVAGMMNLAQNIAQLLQQMSADDEQKDKVRQYQDQLGQLMNLVKGFAQRLSEQKQGGNGAGGIDPETQVKLQGKQLLDQAKADSTAKKTAQKMAFDQVRFEGDEARKDRQANAELRRKGSESYHDMLTRTMEGAAEQMVPTESVKE